MNQNPYQSPTPAAAATDKASSSLLAKTVAMFARHMLILLVMGSILLFAIPRFETMLSELNFKLSAPTLLVLALSRLVVNYWYFALILLPLYLLFLLGLKSTDRRFAGIALAWSVLFWLFTAALLITMIVAIAITFFALMSNL